MSVMRTEAVIDSPDTDDKVVRLPAPCSQEQWPGSFGRVLRLQGGRPARRPPARQLSAGVPPSQRPLLGEDEEASVLLTGLRSHLRCQGPLAAQTALPWRAGSSNRPPRPRRVVVPRWTPPWPQRPPHGGGRKNTLVLSSLHLRVLFVLLPVWGVAGRRLLGTGIGHTACRPTGLSVLIGASTRSALPVSLELCAPLSLSRFRCLMFQSFFIHRTRTARLIRPRPGIRSTQSAARIVRPPL